MLQIIQLIPVPVLTHTQETIVKLKFLVQFQETHVKTAVPVPISRITVLTFVVALLDLLETIVKLKSHVQLDHAKTVQPVIILQIFLASLVPVLMIIMELFVNLSKPVQHFLVKTVVPVLTL
jgi:hypothetical protein